MLNLDVQKLVDTAVPFAQRMLSTQGEFFPFGFVVDSYSVVVAEAVHEESERPLSASVIDNLTKLFRAQSDAAKIRAAAICYDVRTVMPGTAQKTDAICVSVEDDSGVALDLFVPYSKPLIGRIKFGEPFSRQRIPKIFV